MCPSEQQLAWDAKPYMRGSAWQWLNRRRRDAGLCFSTFLVLSFSVLSPPITPAKDPPAVAEPKLLSVFPLGGRQGSTVQAEVRGNFLEGAYAVWFDAGSLSGRLLEVDEAKEQVKEKGYALQEAPEKPPAVYRVRIEVEVPRTAHLGVHSLRLVSPGGISDTVPFRVVNEPVVSGEGEPHPSVGQAQPVKFPVIIYGKLEKAGELDYYSFHAGAGQELSFQALAQNCAPRLALYRAGGSWFDPERPTRLLMQEERSSDLVRSIQGRRTYRVPQDGEYFLEVSSLFGRGTPDSGYQVRIASGEGAPRYEEQLPGAWQERSFSRKLEDGWTTNLEARAIRAGEESPARARDGFPTQGSDPGSSAEREPNQVLDPPSPPSSVAEHEPNDRASQAQHVSIPFVIKGTIEHPGDMDSFKFKVEPGQKLAFEIETPDAKRPYFNPRVGIVDSQDRELFSNVERRISMYNNLSYVFVYLNRLEPKAIYTFERAGEYVLQVRDITARYGSPNYRYKILVRAQIPHVGEVRVTGSPRVGFEKKADPGDHINLMRGEPKRLTVTALYEEGFTGDVSFAFSGLPEGVQTFPAAQFNDDPAPSEVAENSDIIEPKQQKATIVLLASPEAQLTSKPTIVQLHCRPIAQGKLGPSLLVREMPLMVVGGSQQKQKEKPQSGR